MKVLALLLLLVAPFLVSSATHTFLSGGRYNANVLSKEAGRGIQSTVVQIRGGVLGSGKARALLKSINKKSVPSAPAAKKTNKKAAPSAPAAKKINKESAPAAKKTNKKAAPSEAAKKTNKESAPSAPAAKKTNKKAAPSEPAAKETNKKSAPSAPAAKNKFSIDFRERKTQVGLLASIMFCIPILTS
jgi:hypothetical protein